jgi:hypothetical protein
MEELEKLLEHVPQLSGRKTIILTTIIELHGHYIKIAIYTIELIYKIFQCWREREAFTI